jgi:hypothetical protein
MEEQVGEVWVEAFEGGAALVFKEKSTGESREIIPMAISKPARNQNCDHNHRRDNGSEHQFKVSIASIVCCSLVVTLPCCMLVAILWRPCQHRRR